MIDFYLRRTVGIDIREEAVTVTYLGKGLRGYTQFDQTVIRGRILDPAEADGLNGVLRDLREFFQVNRISGEEVSVGIPRSQVFFKSIRIPAPERSMIPDILQYEMDRHLPLPVDETYFDYEIAGVENNLFSIQLTAIRKNQLNRYLDRLASIGIHPSSIDVSTFANRNVLAFSGRRPKSKKGDDPQMNHLFIDISLHQLEIDFFQGRSISYSRSAPLSEAGIVEFFSEDSTGNGETSLDRDETKTDNRFVMGRKIADRILDEIQHVQVALGDLALQDAVTDIVLTGGGKILQIIRENVELVTGMKTLSLDLSGRIRLNGESATHQTHYATSVGLALRTIDSHFKGPNLLPKERRAKRTHLSPYIFLVLGSLSLIFVIAYSLVSYLQVRNDYQDIQRSLENIAPHIQRVEELYLHIGSKAAYLKELSQISQQNTRIVKILDELTRLIPGEAYISEIRITPEQMDIRGLAKSASSLIAPLELSPLFMDVRFDGTIRKSGGLEVFRVKLRHQTP